MTNKYLARFIEKMGHGTQYSIASNKLINKYHNTFMGERDNENHLIILWKNYGFCTYKNGLFTTVNPDEYLEIIKKIPNISQGALAFARTASGNLFVWEDLNISKAISFVNIHKKTKEPIATNFNIFFQFNIGTDNYWQRNCYGKIELKLIEKFGALTSDECYTFVPALALGGNESLKNMKKVKFREQLEILAQLHE